MATKQKVTIDAKAIARINLFQGLSEEQCGHVAAVVKPVEYGAGKSILSEGDQGDTMVLIFKGQVEVTKGILIRTAGGISNSKKAIIRLETTDPPPDEEPNSVATVHVVKLQAFGIGEFSLVSETAIRTATVVATTPIQAGIITIEAFNELAEKDPTIAAPVFREVAKSAVQNLATATQDISNLTQAFFFALST